MTPEQEMIARARLVVHDGQIVKDNLGIKPGWLVIDGRVIPVIPTLNESGPPA